MVLQGLNLGLEYGVGMKKIKVYILIDEGGGWRILSWHKSAFRRK